VSITRPAQLRQGHSTGEYKLSQPRSVHLSSFITLVNKSIHANLIYIINASIRHRITCAKYQLGLQLTLIN